MKKISFTALAAVIITLAGFVPARAQVFEGLGSSSFASDPGITFELKVRENPWRAGGVSDNDLIFIVGEMVTKAGFSLGAETREILAEIWEREVLSQSRWVDQSSPRLREGTIQPATHRLEIVTGGSSDSKRESFELGGARLSTESGTSKAFIVVRIYDLATTKVVETLIGRGEYSSTNVDDIKLDRVLKGLPRLSYWSNERYQNQSPEWRRGMIAVGRALNDLERKLKL